MTEDAFTRKLLQSSSGNPRLAILSSTHSFRTGYLSAQVGQGRSGTYYASGPERAAGTRRTRDRYVGESYLTESGVVITKSSNQLICALECNFSNLSNHDFHMRQKLRYNHRPITSHDAYVNSFSLLISSSWGRMAVLSYDPMKHVCRMYRQPPRLFGCR